ncbi:MAG TPA: hypothetical protein VGD66_00175 [Allosphingosinicella sp.]|jgi:hypothetical protein
MIYYYIMSTGLRLFGSSGSLVANLLLFGTIVALWPSVRECRGQAMCWHGDPVLDIATLGWRPFLDNPDRPDALARPDRLCPGQAYGFGFRLDETPLPAAFDPYGYPNRRLHACVLTSGSGEVRAARLMGGTGDAALDRSMIAYVLRRWRLEPTSDAVTGGWQRIRLNAMSEAPVATLPASLPVDRL